MLDVLSITAPIFILMAIGYAVVRFGLFNAAAMKVLGDYVVTLALPALLFKVISQRPITEIANYGYLIAYTTGSLIVLAGGLFYAKRIQKTDTTSAAFSAMGMVCSNSGFIGYPILLLTLPSIAGVGLALNMLIENILLIPLLLAIAEAGSGEPMPLWATVVRTAKRLVRTPVIIGLAAGFIASILAIPIPDPIMKPIDMMAASSAAISLLVIGGTLAGFSIRGMNAQIAPAIIGKLIFHPLAVLLATLALPFIGAKALAPDVQVMAIIMAAVPMMGIYPLLAQRFGRDRPSAVALLVATGLSFFTLSLILWAATTYLI